jgi:hypothetical protein
MDAAAKGIASRKDPTAAFTLNCRFIEIAPPVAREWRHSIEMCDLLSALMFSNALQASRIGLPFVLP